MIRISTLIIFLFSAFNLQAQVGCKEVMETFYSESLFFRVETPVLFCYCSNKERKQIATPIQEKLDKIKKEIESNLNKYQDDFYATFHACNEYITEEKKEHPYQHTFKLEKNAIKIEGFHTPVIVRMCFYKELDKSTIRKIENKIIKYKE